MIRKHLLAELRSELNVASFQDWLKHETVRLGLLGLQTTRRVEFSSEIYSDRQIRGVVVKRMGPRAAIVQNNGQFDIWIQPGLPTDLKRYSIAHEIAHTYWNSSDRSISSTMARRFRRFSDEIEIICDWFAAKLLVPEQILHSEIQFESNQRHSVIGTLLRSVSHYSRLFCVPERIMTEASFYLTYSLNVAVICVSFRERDRMLPFEEEKKHDPYWQLSWCTVPYIWKASQLPIGFSYYGIGNNRSPRIPAEMIPNWEVGVSTEGIIDGRWAAFGKMQPNELFRKSFRVHTTEEPFTAFGIREGNRLYLAWPLGDDTPLKLFDE